MGAARYVAGLGSRGSDEFNLPAAHDDALKHAEGEQGGHERATTGTNEWQGDTDGRHQFEVHADVDEELEEDHAGDADGKQAAKGVTGFRGDLQHPEK